MYFHLACTYRLQMLLDLGYGVLDGGQRRIKHAIIPVNTWLQQLRNIRTVIWDHTKLHKAQQCDTPAETQWQMLCNLLGYTSTKISASVRNKARYDFVFFHAFQ